MGYGEMQGVNVAKSNGADTGTEKCVTEGKSENREWVRGGRRGWRERDTEVDSGQMNMKCL